MTTLSINNYVFANEQECKKFDVICKSKQSAENFWINTKEFQKKGYKEGVDQIKNTKLRK